jgi:hypothetical protein
MKNTTTNTKTKIKPNIRDITSEDIMRVLARKEQAQQQGRKPTPTQKQNNNNNSWETTVKLLKLFERK